MANEYGMRALQTVTLANSTTAAISFTSIPQTYKHLMIIANLNSQGGGNNVIIKFNGSSSSYGTTQRLGGNNGLTYADAFSPTGGGIMGGTTSGSSTNTLSFGTQWIFIPNYASTSLHKFAIADGGTVQNVPDYHNMASGRWEVTSAITQIDLSNYATANLTSGSTATLYGIEGVETVITPKATGGRIWYDGTYIIHQFTATGTFTPSQNLTADILCVAGGGGAGGNGGGGWPGGGGGAGGYRYSTSRSLVSGTAYTATVGAGGSGGAGGGNGANGSQGSPSSFAGSGFTTLSCVGGGYGAGASDSSGTNGQNGGSGGSGGGGSSDSDSATAGGAGTSGEGFAGSAGVYQPAGGGGSATQIGKNSAFGTPGAINSITGGPVEYARGGGGGTGGSDPGAGLTPPNPTHVNGKINTGNGGNGGHASGASGKNGGSGVVIVRYLAV